MQWLGKFVPCWAVTSLILLRLRGRGGQVPALPALAPELGVPAQAGRRGGGRVSHHAAQLRLQPARAAADQAAAAGGQPGHPQAAEPGPGAQPPRRHRAPPPPRHARPKRRGPALALLGFLWVWLRARVHGEMDHHRQQPGYYHNTCLTRQLTVPVSDVPEPPPPPRRRVTSSGRAGSPVSRGAAQHSPGCVQRAGPKHGAGHRRRNSMHYVGDDLIV